MAEWGRREGTVSLPRRPPPEEIRLGAVSKRVSGALCNVQMRRKWDVSFILSTICFRIYAETMSRGCWFSVLTSTHIYFKHRMCL